MLAHLPAEGNPRLEALLARMDRDGLVAAWWLGADRNSLRAGVNDHGPTHVKIVANLALKLHRLLSAAEVPMSVVVDHGLTEADSRVVVALAAMLHDVGMAVHRDSHEEHSLFVVYDYLLDLLTEAYGPAERVVIAVETMHAMIGHNSAKRCLTTEAGIVKLADALDMTKWRSRAIIRSGRVSIHALSAAAIDKVRIDKGQFKPVGVEILMNSSAGIFQVDSLLKHKLLQSGIQDYVEVSAHLEGPARHEHFPVYNL